MLPPLNTLRAFAACAATTSFRGAAERLHVTPSAVSHQIRQLEDFLGVALFERTTRQVRLTPAGESYLPPVREALRLVETATERVVRHRDRRRLTVSVAPSYAIGWLMPRLPRFQVAHPDIELRLDISVECVDLRNSDIDAALRYAPGGPFTGLVAHHLFDEELIPVCRADGPAAILTHPAELRRQPLIAVSYRTAEWQQWFTLADADAGSAAPEPALTVDYDTVAVDAAVDGLGVALVPRPLARRAVKDGRLTIPFPIALKGTHAACHLVYAQERRDDPVIRAFHIWLIEELGRET